MLTQLSPGNPCSPHRPSALWSNRPFSTLAVPPSSHGLNQDPWESGHHPGSQQKEGTMSCYLLKREWVFALFLLHCVCARVRGHASTCTRVHVFTWLHMCRQGRKSILTMISLEPSTLLKQQGLLLAWSSPAGLDWLASEPQKSAWLQLPLLILQGWRLELRTSCLLIKHFVYWTIPLASRANACRKCPVLSVLSVLSWVPLFCIESIETTRLILHLLGYIIADVNTVMVFQFKQ